MAADLVVFDPATIDTMEPEYVQDLPGNETRMIQNAAGVHHTVVNGEVVIESGVATGACSGEILRPRARRN
jgi:N-acyl-D-aspartate/D-glutamate deacylase